MAATQVRFASHTRSSLQASADTACPRASFDGPSARW